MIDINLTRGLVALLALALLAAALLGYLAWGQDKVAASGPQAPLAQSSGMRGYYLTPVRYNGAEADGTDGNGAGVCASGYHFASLWEILDPSNLKYNHPLGGSRDDDGQGPTSYCRGWVRTGYYNSTSSTPGTGNCNTWSSSSATHRGTTARLPRDWQAGQDIHVWEGLTESCDYVLGVWCVED